MGCLFCFRSVAPRTRHGRLTISILERDSPFSTIHHRYLIRVLLHDPVQLAPADFFSQSFQVVRTLPATFPQSSLQLTYPFPIYLQFKHDDKPFQKSSPYPKRVEECDARREMTILK